MLGGRHAAAIVAVAVAYGLTAGCGFDAAGTAAPGGSTAAPDGSSTPPGADASATEGGSGPMDAGSDTAPAPTASIVMSQAAVPGGAVDLTSNGTLDWVSWFPDHTDKKEGNPGLIGPLTGGSTACGGPFAASIAWSDGTTTMTYSGAAGPCIYDVTRYSFKVAASTNERTVTLLAGFYNTGGGSVTATLTASLSDGSKTASLPFSASGSGGHNAVFTIRYAAATPGVDLNIDWDRGSAPILNFGAAAVKE